jgi:hypothetical protein
MALNVQCLSLAAAEHSKKYLVLGINTGDEMGDGEREDVGRIARRIDEPTICPALCEVEAEACIGGLCQQGHSRGFQDNTRNVVVVDVLRERKPPFSPSRSWASSPPCSRATASPRSAVTVSNVWPVEVFAKVGITYEQNAEPKGTLYTNMLPLINSCRVELLDESRSIAQLCALEGRTARSGLDTIDHPLGGHDELINAIAGVAVGCVGPLGNYDTTYRGWGGTDDTRS